MQYTGSVFGLAVCEKISVHPLFVWMWQSVCVCVPNVIKTIDYYYFYGSNAGAGRIACAILGCKCQSPAQAHIYALPHSWNAPRQRTIKKKTQMELYSLNLKKKWPWQ